MTVSAPLYFNIFVSWVSKWYIITLVIFAVYWYGTRNFSHWKKQGVQYIPPVFFFGNIRKRILFQQSFHEFQRDIYFSFPGQTVAGVFNGTQPSLMIRDPNLIKLILVRDFNHFMDRPMLRFGLSSSINNMLISLEGSHWKSVRGILTPTFSSGKMKAMSMLVENVGKQMSLFLTDLFNEKEECITLELKDFFSRFTMDVIASCAFGVQCDSLQTPNADFAAYASKFNNISIFERVAIFLVLLLCPTLARFFPLSFMNRSVLNFLENVVKETKEHRLKTGTRRDDFLQLMIDASQLNKDDENGKPNVFNEDIIIAQSILFLLAGFETSSTVLACTCYELALNPCVQKKLRSEISMVVQKHQGQDMYDALQEMEYLDMVVHESMRMHPPVARLDRICTSAYGIPGTSVFLQPKANIFVPVMGLHYDSKYYPNPLKFDPMRFSREQKEKRSPYVYLPFGAGPRNCIGARFAMMSTKMALIHLLCDYELHRCSKTEDPYTYSKFSMLLKSQNGIWINIKRIVHDDSDH